jgi:flagellar biosynthesis protein FlhG
MSPSHDIRAVSQALGLGEGRIRFFEKVFPDFLGGGMGERSLVGRAFDDRQISLLRRIDRLMTHEHLDVPTTRRILAREQSAGRRSLRTIAVTSGKGGVGKTFISVNLAIELSRAGYRTMLLDADLGLANVHVLMNIRATHTIMDLLRGDVKAEDLLMNGPAGVQILCGSSGISELADVDPGLLQRADRQLEETTAAFEFLVVDTAAGISSRVLHYLQGADDIVVVVTQNTASILDAYGVIKAATKRKVQGRMGLLVNRVANEAEARLVFDNISACATRFLGCSPTYLGCIPEDPCVEKSFRECAPLVLAHPDSASAPWLRKLADSFLETDRTIPASNTRSGNFFWGDSPRPAPETATRSDRTNDAVQRTQKGMFV